MTDLNQGQTVSLFMIVIGLSLPVIVIALPWEARSRLRSVRTRTRSVLARVLLITAGLALLLVRRLDPDALSRVLTTTTRALLAAAAAGHTGPWPPIYRRIERRHGRPVARLRPAIPPTGLPKDLP